MARQDNADLGRNEGNPNNPGNRIFRRGLIGVQNLSVRQKNIVNPYAQEDAPEGYSLEDDRNRWVVSGIQDSYINFGYFPVVDKLLLVLEGSPLSEDNNRITHDDLLAYLSLYPQNGIISSSSKIEEKSPSQSYASFAELVRRLTEDQKVSLYTSPTSPEAQIPQNQGAISTDDATEEQKLSQNIAQLISIPYKHPRSQLNILRESFQNPQYSSYESPQEIILDPTEDVVPFNPEGVDFDDWKNNCPAGSFSPKIYYNIKDGFYYYTKRTNSTNNEAYDTGRLDYSQSNIAKAIRDGSKGILKFSSKFTEENWDALSVNNNPNIIFASYKDRRPDSRWVYLVKIPKSILDNAQGDPNSASLYANNLEPYDKAVRLINSEKNTTTLHMVFERKYFSSNLTKIVNVLSYYNDLLILHGVGYGRLDGVDLEKEITRVKAIPEDINNLLTLNNIDYGENDVNIDFCMNDNLYVNYVVVGGVLYTEYLGKTLFTPISLNELDDQINLSTINVFSAQTEASLGYWYNSVGQNGILQTTQGRNNRDWPQWVKFVQNYHRPEPTIDPTLLAEAEKKVDITSAFLGDKSKPPKLFETIQDIQRSSPNPSGNPNFASFLQGNLALLDFEKSLSKAAAGCDTPFAGLVKDALFINKVIGGKISTQTLVVKAVNELRSQLMEKNIKLFAEPPEGEFENPIIKSLREDANLPQDPLDPLYTQAAQGNIQPLQTKLENYVDNLISCLLGIGSIQASLKKQLHQGSLPPGVDSLVSLAANEPITVQFFKTPYRKNRTELFWKKVEEIAVRTIKQLILGFVVKMLEALLGCGPENPDQVVQELVNRLELYGFVDLDDFLEGVDVLQVATSVGLQNKRIDFDTRPIPDKILIINSDPRLDQLKQLHNDISAITTPEEIKSLLQGAATERLVEIILEMISSGNINTSELLQEYPQLNGQTLIRERGLGQEPELITIGQVQGRGILSIDNMISNGFSQFSPKEVRIVTNQYQDSLRPGDVRYASLNFTKQSLINYFKEIGKQLGTADVHSLTVDPPQSPGQSFCPDPQPEFDMLSDLQIKTQLAEEIIATQNNIKDMCEIDDTLFDWAGEWWSGLEMPEEVKEFLEMLRKLGDLINKFLSDLFSNEDVLSQEVPSGSGQRTCLKFQNTVLWDQVGSESWENGVLGTEVVSNDTPNELVYSSPQGIQSSSLTEDQLALLPPGISTWLDIGEPSRDEISLLVLTTEQQIITIQREIDVEVENPAEPLHLSAENLSRLREAEAELQEFRRGLNIVATNYDDIILAINEADVPFELKASRLDLVVTKDKASIYRRRFPGGRVLLADASFEIQLDETLSENDERIFDRTIYENFEEQPYDEGGVIPEGSPSITLSNLRDEQGNPSTRLMTVLNRGRVEAGLDNLAGTPSEFIPSLNNAWVTETISRFLEMSDFEDFNENNLEADLEFDALSSVQHIKHRAKNIPIPEPEQNEDNRSNFPAFPHREGDYPLDFLQQLCATFYQKAAGAYDPLAPAMNIISQIPLIETPEKCTKVGLSRAMMRSLQVRIAPFLINILPLMRVYKGFNTPTTLNLLSNYLSRKIKENFNLHHLNPVFSENIDELFLLYQKDLSEGPEVWNSINRNTFNKLVDVGENRRQMDLTYESYDFKLQYVIKKYLVAVFNQWFYYSPQGIPHIWAYKENFYDPQGKSVDLQIPFNTLQNFANACRFLFERLAANNSITDIQRDSVSQLIALLGPDRQRDYTNAGVKAALQIGTYYFPAPAMLATYAIVHDSFIDTSGKYYLYKTIKDGEKRTDDMLKSIVNPSYIPAPERTYDGD
jgi:hypothetical protein